MVEAVIFDWGNVLYEFDNGVFLRAIAGHSDKTPEELERILYEETRLPKRFETGEMDTLDFCKHVIEVCGLDMGTNAFADAYVEGKSWPIMGSQRVVANLLYDEVHRVALLSNTSELDFGRVIRHTPGLDKFYAVTLSYEVGVMKPDERIYEDCLGKLGLPAHECVYVDDVLEYVEAAKDLGMVGIQHTPGITNLEGALRNVGVQI